MQCLLLRPGTKLGFPYAEPCYKPKTVQLKVFCTALGLPDGTAEGVLLPPHVPAAHIVYTHVEPLALSGGLPCSLAERG